VSYKKNISCNAILMAVSLIALALVTATTFNHSYTAIASTKNNDATSLTLGGGPSSSSSRDATGPSANSDILTKKQLSAFTDCIDTANKSQGLTDKVVTNCLGEAKAPLALADTGTTRTPND
jgi:hypothetical protein